MPMLEPPLNRAPWYTPPQLFVMAGLIANTTTGIWGADFIVNGEWSPDKQQATLAAWRKGLGRDYDADQVVKAFKEAGATGMIFYDKWTDGLVHHDTALTGFKAERDFLGETVAALRKYKMKIVVYYSAGLDYNPEPRFQEWTCLDENGNPVGLTFPADWKSFYSPYRQYVIDHLVEITKQYGPIDGFWLDVYGQPGRFYRETYHWGPRYSHDRYTRNAFQARYGKPIAQATDEELEHFLAETLGEFFLEIRQAVSAVQPGVSFTWNGAGRDDIVHPRKAALIDAPADWFSMEGHAWPSINRNVWVGHVVDRPFEVGMLLNSSWYVPMGDHAPPPAMSESEATVLAAMAWIHSGNVYAAMTPGHSGRYDERGDLRLLRAIGDWLHENRPWLVDARPYADVGILAGTPASDLDDIPTLSGLWKASHRALVEMPLTGGELGDQPGMELALDLHRAGYFTERVGSLFAGREFDLHAYRMLVVPETALLDEHTVQAIRDYVRTGGTVLAFGHASLFDPRGHRRANFALADVFGVEFTGTLPGYKQLAVAPEAGLVSNLSLNPGALAVKAVSGRVLAAWSSAGDTPAIVEHQFGTGRSLYVSAEELAFGAGSALLEELTARLIGPPPITITGTREYVLLMNRKGSDLLLYLLNRSTGSRPSSSYLPSRAAGPASPPVTGPEHVCLTIDTSVLGPITRAELIPSSQQVALSRRAGSIRLFVEASPAVTTVRLIKE